MRARTGHRPYRVALLNTLTHGIESGAALSLPLHIAVTVNAVNVETLFARSTLIRVAFILGFASFSEWLFQRLRFWRTDVNFGVRRSPPLCFKCTEEILDELGINNATRQRLRNVAALN